MSGTSILSKLMMGMATVALSTGVWAYGPTQVVTEPVGKTAQMTKDVVWDWGWGMDNPNDPDYIVTDKNTHMVKYLDGVDKGHKMSDHGNMMYGNCMKGDTITNLHTKHSGIITGVKDKGTMDVMKNGKTVRYQYVIYKVKPVK